VSNFALIQVYPGIHATAYPGTADCAGVYRISASVDLSAFGGFVLKLRKRVIHGWILTTRITRVLKPELRCRVWFKNRPVFKKTADPITTLCALVQKGCKYRNVIHLSTNILKKSKFTPDR